MRLLGKPDDGVGPTDQSIVVPAVETRAPEPVLTRENLDAVAAEPLLDSLTVKQCRLGLAGILHYGKNRRRKCCGAHTRELRQKKVDEPYTVGMWA